jgi:Uma2 family endonuclease
VLLRLPEHVGGRSRVDHEDYLVGPPELIVEVAASSVSYDLHQKLDVYRRTGVREYVVERTEDGAIDWFVLREGRYVRQEAAADGLLRSEVFPGLWLDVAALLRGDLKALRAAVERGVATPEHAAFATRLGSS